MKNNELKKFVLNRMCCQFDDITKFKYFDVNNTLVDEKSYENNLI